jgi:hypothetical protein
MPFPGRSAVRRLALLACAAIAGAALGAGPAAAGKHRRARLVAAKTHARGHVPRLSARPPLVGTIPTADGSGQPATTGPTDPAPPAPSCATAVGVTEGEYYTHLSRSTACPGAIMVELRNAGMDDHDLKVLDTDTAEVVASWPVAHPGDAVQKRLTLAAGRYRLFCTLSDGNGAHDTLGMRADLTIG